jgi:hypothetical protein
MINHKIKKPTYAVYFHMYSQMPLHMFQLYQAIIRGSKVYIYLTSINSSNNVSYVTYKTGFIITHEHVFHYFKSSKFNPSQHGFMKSKSTVTKHVTYLDSIAPLVHSQRQVDSIYFDFSNAFDLVSH